VVVRGGPGAAPTERIPPELPFRPDPEEDAEERLDDERPDDEPREGDEGSIEDLEDRVADLATDMLRVVPLRDYSTGRSGAEIHIRRELILLGYPVPVSVHVKAVIWPEGFPSRRRRA
jgi:hypothetical protein